jgi:type I restriction enzyme S subunit
MEKTKPNLRFPNFKDDWKKDIIQNLFEFKNGINKEKECFGQGLPIINFMDVYKNSYITKSNIKGLVKLEPSELERFKVKKGDVFFTRTSETIIDIGMSSTLIEEIENCVFSGFVLRARPISSVFNPVFTGYLFRTNIIRKEITTKSSMTTRALTSGTLLNQVEFYWTDNIIEQTKIASFLSTVDEKINLLKKQLTLLEQYKKGVMQKIFSREIRFKDEDGREFPDWEEKKLGEVSQITTGASNRIDSNLYGEYTFFDRSQDIRSSNRFLFDTEAIIVPGEGQEFIPKYFVGKFDLHQRTYAIMNFQPNFGEFLYYFIGYNSNHLNSQAVGSTVKSLRLPMFEKMPIRLPSLPEQQKIASFLSAIDDKIDKNKEQILKMELWKKGLLQQMFI